MTGHHNPFVRDSVVNRPGIVGARWWNHALQVGSSSSGRRAALIGIGVVAAGTLAFGGLLVWAVASAASDDVVEQPRKALEMQRDYGWNFGAVSETVAFDTKYTKDYARGALKTLEADLAPKGPAHMSHYVPSLFQSPEALPRLTLPDGDTARVTPLAEALRPMVTPAMLELERIGAAYGKLIAASDAGVLTVVDLPGPHAVAFAAGASAYLDPIFLFDNWPHPRGVVPAHETLAAAVYYQPQLARTKAARPPTAMPMAVLDRKRLSAYVDDATRFDNRYLAKLASPRALGVRRVMYVVASSSALPEEDDLNADFVAWRSAGIEVRAVAAEAFTARSPADPALSGGARPVESVLYGGSAKDHESFFAEYPWKQPPPPRRSVLANRDAAAYMPASRATTKITSPPDSGAPGIGYVPVIVAIGTGALLGAKLNRSGSWNRTSGNHGGG